MEKSFRGQIADAQRLHAVPIREGVQAGDFIRPENLSLLPSRFEGTRKELLDTITDTVHTTIDDLDYDGLWPYIKIIDQLNQGKSFREVRVNSCHERPGSTCIGMSQILLENLKASHQINGMFAAQKQEGNHPFEHAAVIIECLDGFVFLDTRSDPKDRVFSIPFESTVEYPYFSITASKAGSVKPLTITYPSTPDHPATRFEYYTNVANGDDIIVKHFVMDASTAFIPIALYNPDGTAHKTIKVYYQESRIEFTDYFLGPIRKSVQSMSFDQVLKGKLSEKLTTFMKPRSESAPRFHLSYDTVYGQLTQFVKEKEKLGQLFRQTNLDATFVE